MNKEDLLLLGQISKVHGKDGAVVLNIRPELFTPLEASKALFIEVSDYSVPFFMEWYEEMSNREFRVKFEGINSREEAAEFTNRKVFIPKTVLPKSHGKSFDLSEIVGFTVIDEKHGKIGQVVEVLELPQQEILKVSSGKKEILVPVAGEIIKSIDAKKREIRISAPDGLIDLYIE